MKDLKSSRVIMHTDQDCLSRYLREVSKIPRVSLEEEVSLGKKIRGGDKEAIRKLACANLLFVVHIAKNYQEQGVPLADLVNEGNKMLFKMTERFDETRGFKFISFVAPWIRAAVLKAVADQKGIIHIPLNQVGLLNKINRVSQKFEAENSIPPSVEEIASLLDVSEYIVIKALRASSNYSSLDANIVAGENFTLNDVLQSGYSHNPDSKLVQESLLYEAETFLNGIANETNAKILRMHFGIGCDSLSNLQISTCLGITKSRVASLKNEAIGRLRKNFEKETMKVR